MYIIVKDTISTATIRFIAGKKLTNNNTIMPKILSIGTSPNTMFSDSLYINNNNVNKQIIIDIMYNELLLVNMSITFSINFN